MFVFLRAAVPCKPNRLVVRAPIPSPKMPAPPLPPNDIEDSDDEMNYEDVLEVSDVEHLMKQPQLLPNPSPPVSQFEQPHSNPSTPCGGPALPHGMAKRISTGAPVPFRQSKEDVSGVNDSF